MKPNGHRANKPFTARSLVGMSQSSRKRKARAVAFVVINSVTFFEHAVPLASALHERLYRERGFPRHSEEMRLVRDVRAKYRIGERLRPCPGCCACWGHRISSAYGEIAECCGPQTSGKRKSQIKAMRKWQETLADDCDGSGVLPARKVQGPGMGTLIPGDWCPVWEPTKAKRPE